MNFNFKSKGFKQQNRITFSCDHETLKLIKKHSIKFNHCQSDLIKQAVKEFVENLEKIENESSNIV